MAEQVLVMLRGVGGGGQVTKRFEVVLTREREVLAILYGGEKNVSTL